MTEEMKVLVEEARAEIIEAFRVMNEEILKTFDEVAPTIIKYEMALRKIRDGFNQETETPYMIARDALESL